MGLITREERKVYLWGEGKKREGGRQGGKEREREREREGMHGTQCKSAECM